VNSKTGFGLGCEKLPKHSKFYIIVFCIISIIIKYTSNMKGFAGMKKIEKGLD
jgi:hypothetical protein